ncbi:MAG: type II toxin-antitoxin system VapC family toxin [Ilumatobacteraceae bacterium]
MTNGAEVLVTYFDSSALVKLVLPEPGREAARALWDASGRCVTSRLSAAEVSAALGAARRARRISGAGLQRARSVWADRHAEVTYVNLDREVADLAVETTLRHALRGADAVQLASALVLGVHVVFACWDERLRLAAAAEGLILAPADVREA